ncbi:type IV pilus twitching motility protein PilT [Hippea maritima]|uniref:Twitching motility protein n=1 Tax=Hippea maritima (strain ATCC 700847 / DSM 10411 / MH2) TaxID=760142 RepID=F2LXP0_HIPMA|nr:PilT/PilU family type 4a pilus ATPase [Hippea maritima]AEA33226.1 twitching motility protein [Hippea maritima DSM 10411]
MRVDDILKKGTLKGASDIHIKVGSKPFFRINGEMIRDDEDEPLSEADFNEFLSNEKVDDFLVEKFKKERQVDIGYGLSGVGRFRVNMLYQRGTPAAIFRFIPFDIPDLDSLNLPKVIETIALKPRGLVLVTGVTGSGKSTTLASMVDIINKKRKKNIITIEDPIEYLHKDINSSIIQRQVGYDVLTFADGLRGALREDPDVILVGEMRDRETISTALEAVETGHLVMSTLHTKDATETINRIIAAFPLNEQRQVRLQLSATIEAVISQRLLKRKDGNGMVPAVEIMIASELVRDAILDAEKIHNIKRSIEINREIYGTQSFDQSLMELYKNGLVSFEEAKEYSSNPNDFALKVRGIG